VRDTGSLALTPDFGAPTRAGAFVAWLPTAAPFVFGLLLTGLLAADHGGYWPTAWGWTTLALAWVAVVALVLSDERPGPFDIAWIGGLLAVTGWTAASWLWTSSQTQTALEVERALVYVAVALATVAVVRSEGVEGLIWGVWLGTSLVCLYALATRLFPDRLGVTDAVAGYRLATPVGYWNGLGLVAAIAALLALGLLVHGGPLFARAAAGASLPVLVATLYFTFSRGAWVALAAALLVVVALSPWRLRVITGLFVAAVPSGVALALAYDARPLRRLDVSAAQAVHAGHTLAWRLALVVLAAAIVTSAYGIVAARVRVPDRGRQAYAAVLAALALAGTATVVVHYGGPVSLVSKARGSLAGGSPQSGNDLSKHLLTLSSPARLDQWHVAVQEWKSHRLAGSGAGTYAQYWMAARSDREKVLDVHNLYLETLAELGVVGLCVLVATLLVPLLAAFRGRGRPIVAIAAGGYAAWLAHAAYDWDWELPGVTVVALLCAGAILAAARGEALRIRPRVRWQLLLAVCVVGVLGTIGLIGNRALAQSGHASRNGNLAAAAADAKSAHRWAPWSSQPWEQLAAIRLAQGKRAAALTAYRQAVAKDPQSWELWLALAGSSTGRERARAVAKLSQLSPALASAFAPGSP
jgi:hypothetical protein